MGFLRFSNLKQIYRASSSCSSPITNHRLNYYVIAINSPIQQLPLVFPNDPHRNIPKRWHGGHPHHHHHHQESDYVFKLGFAADIALASGKALTGYLSGSTAIIADAVHSVSDVVLSGVALLSFRVARAPKDKEHPYGHGKFETLGALGISGMLLATAGGIAWHAIDILMGLLISNPEVINHSVLHGHVHNHGHIGGHQHGLDMEHPVLALNMMIFSIGVKEGLYWVTKKAGEKKGSGLMMASAWHHRADAISSIVALVGVGGSILGVKFLDPLAGLIVSGMILKAGIETGHQSIMELVDAGVPLSHLDPMKQTILQVEGVMGCHRLRGRRAGSSLYLDVHIEVDPFSSVSAAHNIGENVRHRIQKSHDEVAEVFIHIDPSVSKLSPKLADQSSKSEEDGEKLGVLAHQKHVEDIVSEIIASKFQKVMTVEHITHHSLQGKLLLQVEVSMPPQMLIQDAMDVAEKAEKEILMATSNLSQVSIQLRLGHPIPQFHHES